MGTRREGWRWNWIGALLLLLGSARADAQVPEGLEALRVQARAEGSVPVLVALDVPFVAEGRLSSAEVRAQRARTRQVREGLLAALAADDIGRVKVYETVPMIALRVTPEQLERLARRPEVRAVGRDGVLYQALDESTTQIGAQRAWALGYTGAGQTVAIIDAGIQTDHPFYAGKVVAEACFSEAFIRPTEQRYTMCPDSTLEMIGEGAGGCHPYGGCAHGTQIAGILAGSRALRAGTLPDAGVAPDAQLISVQVHSKHVYETIVQGKPTIIQEVSAPWSDIAAGLDYLFQLSDTFHIAAVNLSLASDPIDSEEACDGFEDTPEEAFVSLKPFIDNLWSVGIPTVAASGNASSKTGLGYPACISTAVSVGSVTGTDAVSNSSNVASFLDLLAPGVGVATSTVGSSYATVEGTSFAAPHVAGAFALLREKYPTRSIDSLLALLTTYGVPVADTRSGDTTAVVPRLQVDAALGYDLRLTQADAQVRWRLLSVPLAKPTLAPLVAPFWTQGFPGADADPTNPAAANVFTYDETQPGTAEDGWTVPASQTMALQPGQGVAVAVFPDDDYDGVAEDFPKTHTVHGLAPAGPVEATVTYTGTGQPAEDGWNLVGNPYPTGLDWDAVARTNVGATAYLWDPAESRYRLTDTPDVPDNQIAPFQGFFVQAIGPTPRLTMPASAETGTAPTFYGRTGSPPLLALLLETPVGSSRAYLQAERRVAEGRDPRDAYTLTPLSTTYALVGLGTSTSAADQPLFARRVVDPRRGPWPLVVEAVQDGQPVGGTFTLRWTGAEAIPAERTVVLTDHRTGQRIDLRQQTSYVFEQVPADSPAAARTASTLPSVARLRAPSVRFTLDLAPRNGARVAADEEEQPEPYRIGAAYPNPTRSGAVLPLDVAYATAVGVTVYDLLGRSVGQSETSLEAGSHRLRLPVEGLAAGSYVVHVRGSSVPGRATWQHRQRLVLVR